jgi:hypothetical protein
MDNRNPRYGMMGLKPKQENGRGHGCKTKTSRDGQGRSEKASQEAEDNQDIHHVSAPFIRSTRRIDEGFSWLEGG